MNEPLILIGRALPELPRDAGAHIKEGEVVEMRAGYDLGGHPFVEIKRKQ